MSETPNSSASSDSSLKPTGSRCRSDTCSTRYVFGSVPPRRERLRVRVVRVELRRRASSSCFCRSPTRSMRPCTSADERRRVPHGAGVAWASLNACGSNPATASRRAAPAPRARARRRRASPATTRCSAQPTNARGERARRSRPLPTARGRRAVACALNASTVRVARHAAERQALQPAEVDLLERGRHARAASGACSAADGAERRQRQRRAARHGGLRADRDRARDRRRTSRARTARTRAARRGGRERERRATRKLHAAHERRPAAARHGEASGRDAPARLGGAVARDTSFQERALMTVGVQAGCRNGAREGAVPASAG